MVAEDHVERVGNHLRRAERDRRKRPVTQRRKDEAGPPPSGTVAIVGGVDDPPDYGHTPDPSYVWTTTSPTLVLPPTTAIKVALTTTDPEEGLTGSYWVLVQHTDPTYYVEATDQETPFPEDESINGQFRAIDAALFQTVGVLEAVLNDLISRVDGFEDAINDPDTGLGELASRVTGLEGDVASLDDRVTYLEGEL